MSEKNYHQMIRTLSDRIVSAQRPIRVLDALKWEPSIKQKFFDKKCKEPPKVDEKYYEKHALPYDPNEKIKEFLEIERAVRRELGQFSRIGNIMVRMCREYQTVVRMLMARGKPQFSELSQQLYGSSFDAFYAGAPTLMDLANTVSQAIVSIQKETEHQDEDQAVYSAEDAVQILNDRLRVYFEEHNGTAKVAISDGIIADAAAGAETIKLRSGARFSKRDLQVLEVHEGWVHLGTTINGMNQPICTFLSKGPPSATMTQEGLAIIMEIFTFSSHPGRIQGLIDRIKAINMAESGAHFMDVFKFFREQGISEEESYRRTERVYRGSTPDGGPFTKDLVYNKGFILIYNYIRLSVQRGLLSRIPLLFLGKTTLEDLHIFGDLLEEGILKSPKFIPPQFKDLAGLSSWMCYSLFLNQLDLKHLAKEYKSIL